MILLRWYQEELDAGVVDAFDHGARVVCLVAPTGAGKTVLEAHFIKRYALMGPVLIMAHRSELVGQISEAIARAEILHRVIGSRATVKNCSALHGLTCGRSWINPRSNVIVASVDTLLARIDELRPLLATVRHWLTDEGHHVLRDNKWGSVVSAMHNARGILLTATPERADGAGLGSHADGFADALVCGPSGNDLIMDGYLSPFKIYGCESLGRDVIDALPVGATGDFTSNALRRATRESKRIVGDTVEHYLRHAAGKPGVVFTTEISETERLAAAFTDAGIRAAALSGKTPDTIRAQVLAAMARGEYDQLINVDLFGEGFNLPAITSVSFDRATASFAMYSQQFGRALRTVYAPGAPLDTPAQRRQAIADGPKPHAVILDHVGNVLRHGGEPTRPRVWTLDRRAKRKKNDGEIPLTYCGGCTQPYEKTHTACPYCGYVEPQRAPSERTSPDRVDGDLVELTSDALEALRAEVIDIERTWGDLMTHYAATGLPSRVVARNAREALNTIEAQRALRDAMAQWAGFRGHNDTRRLQKEFYYKFGLDVLSAQALKKTDATTLALRVVADYA